MNTLLGRSRRLVDNKRWVRVLPVIVLIYVIAYVDRTSISFALPHIGRDFDLSGSQQGLLSGIFFFGYVVLQVPGGYIAERWSARWWITVLILLWGTCIVCASFVDSYPQLLLSRFLLGLAEGGVQPALMVTIRAWFPFGERSRAYAIFKLYAPISSLITAPTAGLILEYGDWRELFLIQGGVPVVIALVLWLWLMRDRPSGARWVSHAERAHIGEAAAREAGTESAGPETGRADGTGVGDPGPGANRFRAALTSKTVWLFTAAYSLTMLGMYGIQMWLPTLLGRSFHTDAEVGFVAMIPPVVGAVAIVLVGRSADRRGGHVAHVCWTLGAGAAVLVVASRLSVDQKWLVLAAMVIATASSLAYYGPMWAMVTKLVPAGAVAVGIGVINGVGNLGGFVGPYIGGVLNDLTGTMALSQVFFAVALLGAAAIIFSLRKQMRDAMAAPEAGEAAGAAGSALKEARRVR